MPTSNQTNVVDPPLSPTSPAYSPTTIPPDEDEMTNIAVDPPLSPTSPAYSPTTIPPDDDYEITQTNPSINIRIGP